MQDGLYSEFLLDEGDDDQDNLEMSTLSRDGAIFLIDCTPSMVASILPRDIDSKLPIDHEMADTGVRLALLCCQTFLQNKAISSEDDLIGLVFMRASKSEADDFKGISIIQPLNLTDAQRILEIENLRKLSAQTFTKEFQCTACENGFPLHDALWVCQDMFIKSPKTLAYKRIFILTDDPDPIGSRSQLKRQAIAKANDLIQSGIEIEILPIKQEGMDFDIDLFYKFLQLDSDGDANASLVADPSLRLEELLTRVHSRELKRHRLARLPLFLLPSTSKLVSEGSAATCVAFAVSAYCLVRPAPSPKLLRLAAATNELVVSSRRTYKVPKGAHPDLDPTTIPENLVSPQDLIKGMVIGSRTVCFDRSELNNKIKQIAPVGIHLLGFKPLRKFKREHYLRPAQFIYPDEATAKGSTMWFTTLLSVCLKKEVFGIALYVQRRAAPPHLVALLPQAEKLDDFGAQLAAPGFHVIFLPFADDFRNVTLPNFPAAEADQVELAKSFIKKLLIPYDPESISNPRLLKHYAELEALALERSTVTIPPDHTLPNSAAFKRRAGDQLNAFNEAVGMSDLPAKTAKASAPSDLSVSQLQEDALSGSLSKFTVPILKQAITLLKLKPISNKKADLISAIENYFSS